MKNSVLLLTVVLALGICAETVVKNSAPFSLPPPTGVIRGGVGVQNSNLSFTYAIHPSNSSAVVFSWSIPGKPAKGTIAIFTLAGTKVKSFPITRQHDSVSWGIADGTKPANGVYFATIAYGAFKKNMQLFLLR